MTLLLAALFIIVVLYLLLVKGWLFKIILFLAGGFGLYVALWTWLPDTHAVAFTTGSGSQHSWAFVISIFVCICALATTKSES